jgi:CMP-N-acetylneuraminic acid synthetase
MEILGLVTARGGSKGIPGKNIAPAGGRPLIAWTIEAARNAPSIHRVVVTTDSETIAQVAREWHAEVPFLRPAELARDDSPHIDTVCHAIRWLDDSEDYRPDYVLTLQPTSPLRTSHDIEAAVGIATNQNADAVVGVCPTKHHPFLTRRITESGTLSDFVTCDLAYPRRQALLPAYALNGAIILTRRDVLLVQRTFFPARTFPYVMPPERSLDVDDRWDFYLLELILADRARSGKV